MKKNNLYFGTDTYGTNIEVGINNEGVQFYRSYSFNGYGMAWQKWQKLEEPCQIINNGDQLKWGWNELNGCYYNRIRLPKI